MISIESLAHVHFIFVWEWLYILFIKVSFNNSNKGRQHTRADAYVGAVMVTCGSCLPAASLSWVRDATQSAEWESEWNRDAHYDCSSEHRLRWVAIIWRGMFGDCISPVIVQVPRCTHREGRVEFNQGWRMKWQPTPVFAWRIPGMGEPGGLLSVGLPRVRHDWSNVAAVAVP